MRSNPLRIETTVKSKSLDGRVVIKPAAHAASAMPPPASSSVSARRSRLRHETHGHSYHPATRSSARVSESLNRALGGEQMFLGGVDTAERRAYEERARKS